MSGGQCEGAVGLVIAPCEAQNPEGNISGASTENTALMPRRGEARTTVIIAI